MIRVLFLLKFTFFIFISAKAEVVNNISISGNSRVSNETIKVYGKIELNKDYGEEDLNRILNDLYSTNFFENVELNLINGVLNINLTEYPMINQLILLGESNKNYQERIKKIIRLKQKNSFIESFLSKDLETIKKLYSSVGYNNSKIETKIKKNEGNSVDLIFEINRGNQTRISSISFIGDKKIRDRRLRDVIVSEEDNFWKIISKNTLFSEARVKLDTRLLTNFYKSQGFYDVEVNSNSAELDDKGNVNLVYSIDAGKRYIIKKISTNLDPVFDANIFFPLKETYERYTGSYYSPFYIKKLLDQIDEIIAKNSLQFVEHNVEETIVNDTINIKFNIFESEKILVERINVIGNNVTNENVIRGELLVDEGDPFTKVNLDKSVANLKSRRIFRSVETKVNEGSEKNLKVIDIEVEEQPTGELSAGAGVGTNGGTFAINVSENNWLGEGKNLNFEVEVDEESLAGRIQYTNTNYDFLGNSLSYHLENESNDKPNQGYENTVLSAGVSTSFEQYKDIFANLGIFASYDDLRTLDSASASLKKQSGNFSEIAGVYGFKYDKRNRTFMPTSGSVTSFSQTLPIYADKRYISNDFSTSYYKSFSDNIIGAGKLFVSSVNGIGDDDVRLSKRKFISSKRLRGFQRGKVGPKDGQDHIGGNYLAAVNFEASLPNLLPETSKTEVGLFLDFGNVWGVDYDSTIDDSNEIRSSTGISASWLSPLGPMTFTFATSLSKANSDETETFNFNLGTTF